MWVGFSAMWLAAGGAVAYAIHVTHNPSCLWALLIPTMVSFSSRGKDNAE